MFPCTTHYYIFLLLQADKINAFAVRFCCFLIGYTYILQFYPSPIQLQNGRLCEARGLMLSVARFITDT